MEAPVSLPGARPLRRDDFENVRLFKDVAIEAIWHLLERCPIRALAPDEVLIAPGDQSRGLFVVLSGRLRVHLSTPEDEPVAHIEQGGTVGELALIDDRPRSAYVVADAESRVLELLPAFAWSLLHSSHEATLNLLGILAERLRGNNATVNESRKLQAQYARHAATDALTGLYNRRWLDDMFPRLVRRSQMQSQPLSVLMIDIDHFKRFNDSFGHAAGDFVLFAVARTLRERLRPTDLVARYGGEELTVVLPMTDGAGARVAGERARTAIEQLALVMPDGTELPGVTASIGFAELAAGESAADATARADGHLYRAKREGRNRVEG